MLSIFQIPRKGTAPCIFLATPEVWAEYNVEDLRLTATDTVKCYETVWLEILLEGLLTLDIHTGVRVIFVRTNIRKLAAVLDRQLYVKDYNASEISYAIHGELSRLSTKANPHNEESSTPLELRGVLLPLPHQ